MNKTVTFETPALFADHHVLEVRRVLLATAGVVDVYASSAFRLVDVTFDDAQLSEPQISRILEDTGYLGQWTPPSEMGVAAHLQSDKALSYFRHTEIQDTSRQVLSFAQKVAYTGRPLWNCPGFGVIKNTMED
jgi:copper chaperone CopZ